MKTKKLLLILLATILLIAISGQAHSEENNIPNEETLNEQDSNENEQESSEEDNQEGINEQSSTENEAVEEEQTPIDEEVYIPIENVEEILNEQDSNNEEKETNNEDQGQIIDEIDEEDYVDKEQLEEILEDIDENADYVDIDTFIEPEKETNKTNETEEENNTSKRIEKKLVKNGELELEYEISSEAEDVNIEKKEVLIDETEKWITVSSEEHFDEELRAYSDLPQEANIEDIKIYWENEQKQVTEGIIYFDTDSNGKPDRVSWPIPHLSTQLYSIHIEIDDAGGTSTSIAISVVSPPNNTDAQNPVNFSFDINYTNVSALECDLAITMSNGTTILFPLITQDLDVDVSNTNLGSGQVDWALFCKDIHNTTINTTVPGYFNLENDLNLAMDQSLYWKGDGIGYDINANGGNTYLNLTRPGGDTVHPTGFSGTSTSGNIPTATAGALGDYTLIAINDYFDNNVTDTETFSVGDIELDYDNDVAEDEEITLQATIYSTLAGTVYFLVDGNVVGAKSFSADMGGTNEEVNYTPDTQGTYDVELIVDVPGIINKTKDFGDLTVDSGADDEDPDINLVFPDWQEVVTSAEIDFVYSVSDNVGMLNCSLSIYNSSESESGVYETGDLLFPTNANDEDTATKTSDFTNDEDIEVKLVDFDDQPYIWEVECYDTEGNRGWDFNYFEVDTNDTDSETESVGGSSTGLNDYDRKGEIDSLLNSINDFLEKQGNFNPEQKTIADIMGIAKAANAHKKKLLQIDQDLGYNLDFMEENKRIDRLQEINQEIDQIKEDLVTSINVLKSYEYTKTSTDKELEELIDSYLEATNTNIKSRDKKNILALNEELQKDLTSEVFVWKVQLEKGGAEELQELIIVKKELGIKGNFEGEILEFLDSSFDVPEFITPTKEIGNGIFEFYTEDLEDNSLIYYFDDSFALEDIEKTEIILFEESVSENNKLTGFAVAFDGGFSFSWLAIILGVLLMGYLGFYVTGRVRTKQMLVTAPGASVMTELIEQTKKLLKEKKIDLARDNYYKMNETYKALDPKAQAYFYKDIKMIRTTINKKDIIGLVKEYEKAKEEYRREDAQQLYARISELYKILPKKYQDKVYRRLVKK